jgi:signal transduction histidine kinase
MISSPVTPDGAVARTASDAGVVSVEALELFVGVLAQSGPGHVGGDEFYAGLCDAICRLAGMRRALIFRYDDASRRVRAVGAHGLDLALFADAHVTVDTAPIAAEALRGDLVVEAIGDLRDQFPPEYAALVEEPLRLVCAPMAAAGRAIGVILADRTLSDPPIDATERQLLWTLGKAAALAAVARIVATEREASRQLEQRIDLAREIHESVIQRLFGVSMALDGEGDLSAEARARCAAETQAALGDLRTALQRPLGRMPPATGTTLLAEVERLGRAHPELGIRLRAGQPGDVPPAIEPLAQSVLTEAVRNARKHAHPTTVSVSVRRVQRTFVLEVVNDGISDHEQHAGMGLRLAAFEALQSGGIVEFGEREPGSWQVRLVVPLHE